MIDNSNIKTILLFALLFFSIIAVVITVFIVKSRQKIFSKEIENRNLEIEYQKQIISKTLETQETERKRIAQDLHDDISSKLIALSLNVHLLKSVKTPESNKESIIATIESINKNAIETSRKIAHHLFPPLLEKFGANEAIEEVVSDYNSSKQIQIHFENNTNLNQMPKMNQLHIFRITQELINNSIKHGKATEIYLTFTDSFCDYSDNGSGIEKALFENNKGLGMMNIDSRIRSINGTTKINFDTQGFALKYTYLDGN